VKLARSAIKEERLMLRRHGVRFRNDVVAGVGGQQIIAEDPSGNPVELFEPALPEARLSPASVPD
jgi:hypothetical protein